MKQCILKQCTLASFTLKNFHISYRQLVAHGHMYFLTQTFQTRISFHFYCTDHKMNPPAGFIKHSVFIGFQALPAALRCNNGFYDGILSKIPSLVTPQASKLFLITFYTFAFFNINCGNWKFQPAFNALTADADNIFDEFYFKQAEVSLLGDRGGENVFQRNIQKKNHCNRYW